MTWRLENAEALPDLSAEQKKEIISNLKDEIRNMIIREKFIKVHLPNYDPDETYVIYDGKVIFVYNGELHRLRIAKKEYSSFYISKPDHHVGR